MIRTAEVVFAIIALLLVSYGAYTDGHAAGFKQGQFEVRFECEQQKAAAVEDAVHVAASR